MTHLIRETDNYLIYKSLAGLGISVVRREDGEQSLFDTDLCDVITQTFILAAEGPELNDWITKQIKF